MLTGDELTAALERRDKKLSRVKKILSTLLILVFISFTAYFGLNAVGIVKGVTIMDVFTAFMIEVFLFIVIWMIGSILITAIEYSDIENW